MSRFHRFKICTWLLSVGAVLNWLQHLESLPQSAYFCDHLWIFDMAFVCVIWKLLSNRRLYQHMYKFECAFLNFTAHRNYLLFVCWHLWDLEVLMPVGHLACYLSKQLLPVCPAKYGRVSLCISWARYTCSPGLPFEWVDVMQLSSGIETVRFAVFSAMWVDNVCALKFFLHLPYFLCTTLLFCPAH